MTTSSRNSLGTRQLLVAGAAAGAGLALAMLIPVAQRERALLGPVADALDAAGVALAKELAGESVGLVSELVANQS